MYYKSYKQTHSTSGLSYYVSGNYGGYNVTSSEKMLSDCNGIYVKADNSKADGIMLASPSVGTNNKCLVGFNYKGELFLYNSDYADLFGLRPLVCLKSDVRLKKTSDGVYEIQ